MIEEEDGEESYDGLYYMMGIVTPPCSRYDEGEGNERVIRTWCYVTGRLGAERARSIANRIARLHDHKGRLIVALHDRLPGWVEEVFRNAWMCLGNESKDAVEFQDVERFMADTWTGRRFESDWTQDISTEEYHERDCMIRPENQIVRQVREQLARGEEDSLAFKAL
jgi:hypothetical protein